MNERMKIIVKKAHEYADQHWREDGYPFFEEYHQVFSNNYQQKFAELIVRECAELIDNKVTITAAETYDEVFVAKFDTKELCAKQIREHFGVEE
jgi:hypothetical protein